MSAFLRWFLPLYLVAYVAGAFVWRSWLVYRRTGINPYVLGSGDTPHDFIGRIFKLAFASVFTAVGLYAFAPKAYIYLGPLLWLDRPAVALAGVAVLLAALAWILVAQAQMGDSWRIGVDAKHATGLIEQGLFTRSRNPIFLGMRASLLGFFLCLPNALTLAVLLLGDALMQVQVRLEEEHLTRLHGEAYRAYRSRVRRWL